MGIDPEIVAELVELRKKYEMLIIRWFQKFNSNHKYYNAFTKMKLALEGKYDNFTWKNLQVLKQNLNVFIPDEKFFNKNVVDLTSDSDDDDIERRMHKIHFSSTAQSSSGYDSASRSSKSSNWREEMDDAIMELMSPSMEISPVKDQNKNVPKTPLKKTPKKIQESIGTYFIKTTRLPPASLFAKPSEVKENLQIIENPFNTKYEAPTQISNEEAEEKLKKVREKIQKQVFENMYTDEKSVAFKEISKRSLSVLPCKTFKRRNSVHAKAISKENLQKARMKRRQSCFVKQSPEKANEVAGPRCAIKRTRVKSLFKPPAKGNKTDQIRETFVNQFIPNRHVIQRARKEVNDIDLEKTLPKPDYNDYEVDEEFKELLDLIPLP